MNKLAATLAREIREAVSPTIFFLVLFHLIALTRAVSLGDYSATALRATVATVGALIVAKSILLVEALPVARWFSGRLIFNVLWKTLLFGVVALLFRFIEELIPLLLKHDGVVAAATSLGGEVAWPQFWVFQLWLFCALFCYCLAVELIHMIGGAKVSGMIFGSRSEEPPGHH